MADLIPLKPKQLDLSPAADVTAEAVVIVQNTEIEPAKRLPITDLLKLKPADIVYVTDWNMRATYYSPAVTIPKNAYIQAVHIIGDDGTIQTDKLYDMGTNANVVNKTEHRDLTLSSDIKARQRYMYGQRPCIDIIPYVQPISGNTVSNSLTLLHNAPSALNQRVLEKTINLDQEYFKNGDKVATLLQWWHAEQPYDAKTVRIVFPPPEDNITDSNKFHELLQIFQIGDEIIDPYSEASPIYFYPNTRIESISFNFLASSWIPTYDASGVFKGYESYCSEIVLHLNKPRITAPAPPQDTISTFVLRSKCNEDGTKETSYQEQIRQIADVSGGNPQNAAGGYFLPINDSQLTNFKNTGTTRAVIFLGTLLE